MKHVVVLPSLISDLKEFERVALAGLADLPPSYAHMDDLSSVQSSPLVKSVIDATSVLDLYRFPGARCFNAVASMVLHPYMKQWTSVMSWGSMIDNDHPAAFREDCTLRIPQRADMVLPEEVIKALTPEDANRLLRLSKRFPYLATWEVFAQSTAAEAIIRDMGALPVVFNHYICPSTGYTPPCHLSPVIVDAIESPPWSLPVAKTTRSLKSLDNARETLSRTGRGFLRKSTRLDGHDTRTSSVTVPSSKDQTLSERERSSAVAFLEHVSQTSVPMLLPMLIDMRRHGLNLYGKIPPS